MILLKLTFLVTALIICTTLIVLMMKMRSAQTPLKKHITPMFALGLCSVIFYSIFLFCDSYWYAMIFDTLFFCSLDWLVYSVLTFSFAYTNRNPQHPYRFVLLVMSAVDSLFLLLNLKTLHSFDLDLLYFSKNLIPYWGAVFTPVHYLHLGFCYIMVFSSFALIAMAMIKAPLFYKKKYISVLVAYIIIIVINVFCYSLNTPVDFSVFMYTFLAIFIYYYSTYRFPHQLVNCLLANVNERISEGIVFFDADGKFAYANASGRFLMGDTAKRATFSAATAERYARTWQKFHPEPSSKGEDSFTINGTNLHFQVEFQKVFSDGEEIGSFFKFVNKTDEIKQLKRQRYISTHDEMTGLLNRTGFFEAVSERQQSDLSEYLMLVSNIRDFKIINEIFGEETGDKILMMEADFLRQADGIDALCGRIDDDKFAMFLKKEYFSMKKTIDEFQKIQQITENSAFKIHFTLGIYESRFAFESPRLMCDKALLATEKNSDDYQHIFAEYDSEMLEQLLVEKDIVSDFETALSKGQFCIFLQPQISIDDMNFSCEALARWRHPERGILQPKEFIEILEKTGLIHKLDAYIWEEAAKKIREWNDKGIRNWSISVNVSPKDFYYIDIFKTLVEIVQKYNISPSLLNIEFTETAFVENFEKSRKLTKNLQQFGFKVEIDDFGSGYSSLNMLKDIDADVLKIDRVFLKETEHHDRGMTILSSIVSMAKSLNMEVLAEGVETDSQILMLKELGCEAFRGFLFAEPMEVSEFERAFVFRKPKNLFL